MRQTVLRFALGFFAALYPAASQTIPIQPAALPNSVAGAAYSVQFTGSSAYPPLTWTLASGSLPTGLSLSSSGLLSGTPARDGAFPFTVQAADTVRLTGTRAYTLTVRPAIVIATASPLAPASAGASYSAAIGASGGWPPYTYSAEPALPSGLRLDASTGVLSGIPSAAGTFTFNVKVTDSSQFSATKSFSLTVQNAAQLLTSAGSLVFSAWESGDSPIAQSLLVSTSDGSAARFSVRVEGAAAGSAAPAWVVVQPLSGVTPARLSVSMDSSALGAADYSARVVITGAGGQATTVPVAFTVSQQTQALEVTPRYLRLTAPAQPAGVVESTLLIRNSGGEGPIDFQASVSNSTWLTVEPAAGRTAPNSYTILRVFADPSQLRQDAYRAAVRITSNAGDFEAPVAFFLPEAGPALGLGYNGVRFDLRQSQGASDARTVSVLNLGDDTVNWTAEVVRGQEWLSLGATSGQATAARPGTISLTANSGSLDAGRYYALVRLTDPQALNSPQYLTAVLNLVAAASAPAPQLTPSGLVFTGVAGAAETLRQSIRVFASSLTPVPYQATASTPDGADWLSADPSTGQAYTTTGQINVTVNGAKLKPGVYTGEVTVSLAGGQTRAAGVTFIVTPPVNAAAKSSRAAAGCTPSRLSITLTDLGNFFSVPAAWPQPVVARVADDCGEPVADARVVASFSNGDPPLSLRLADRNTGSFAAAWTPGSAASPASVSIRAIAQGFDIVSAQIDGLVQANGAPVLATNGVVNTFNPVTAAPIAPGTLIQVRGSRLSSVSAEAGVIPLPSTMSGVTVLTGGMQAPLFSVSPDRIDAQFPVELKPGRQYQVVVSSGAAVTVADTISLTSVRPGIFASSEGLAVARHADTSPITPSAPAKPGEQITVFLAGMGATDTVVASGEASPAEPPALAVFQPEVSMGGRRSDVIFAGLSPGMVGLYSVSLRVPSDAAAGDLTLTVSQDGVAANSVTVPVAP
ncbi:MAG TPA: putative Ig domain-containing protein [Bryobacteraceae bacterium]|nr:putative Ig domain-containing protein [Bryobacteraceae bacterium]